MDGPSAGATMFKLALTPNSFVMLHLVASLFTTITVAVLAISLKDKLTPDLIKESMPNLLKVLTVYLIIWVGGELALVGAFDQGISTLFAAIIGYVFGSYRATGAAKPRPSAVLPPDRDLKSQSTPGALMGTPIPPEESDS